MLNLGKYRYVILLTALFLVIFGAVMVLTFVISRQIAADAVSLNLAGQQRTQVQQVVKTVLLLEQGSTQGVIDSNGATSFSELRDLYSTVDALNAALAAFREGGMQLESGARVALTPQDDVQAAAFFKLLDELWAPINQQVQQLRKKDNVTSADFGALLQVLVPDNLNLLETSNLLTSRMESLSAEKASTLRKIQTAGIALAFLNFALIVYVFLGRLRASDSEVERMQVETENILRTMQEGLFLLDNNFHIGSQTSNALSQVMGVSVKPGGDFLAMLKPMVSQKTLDTTKEYIELLLRFDVKEKLVASLNPLDALEINTTRENGAVETRFLNFRFNRVVVKGKITHLLVTTSDITRRVKLERELIHSERQVQDQMAMMVYILQADASQMRDFLEGAVAGLNRINAALKGGSASGVANADIDHFFRIAHRIKGDAAALNLQAIATSLHSFEDLLQGLRNKPQLQNEDLLPVIVRVRTIYAELHAIQEAMARIAQVRGVVNVEPPKPVHDPVRQNSPFVTQWRNLAHQIANRKGKKAELTYQGVDLEKITKSMRETIDTIVTQLIRNAVTHGLETPKERTDQGKVEQGAIAVYLSEAGDGALELSFRDDGAGINVEKLREAAVRIGSLNAEKARVADVRQLTELIFKPGFSTHDTIDEDAGRGVGLDVVRDLVSRLRGRIHIGTAPGKYCHFRVQIPSHLFASSNLATLALQTEAHG